MLPEKVYIDNEAPEIGGIPDSCDAMGTDARDRLRSLIMDLTDDECDLLWKQWEVSHNFYR